MSIVSQMVCDGCGKPIDGGEYVYVHRAVLPNKNGSVVAIHIPNPERHYHSGCINLPPAVTNAAQASTTDWKEVFIDFASKAEVDDCARTAAY